MAVPSLGNLGAKLTKNVIPSFQDLFYRNRTLLSLDNNLKRFIQIILVCLHCSFKFPKCIAHKKKSCVYFNTFQHIHSFP